MSLVSDFVDFHKRDVCDECLDVLSVMCKDIGLVRINCNVCDACKSFKHDCSNLNTRLRVAFYRAKQKEKSSDL